MAVYRFKVVFEDDDEVYREIDMLPKNTFEDFHNIIHQSTGYNTEQSAAFYKSNDKWKKGKEIVSRLSTDKGKESQSSFHTLKLAKCIDDTHQKFYYVYNFEEPYSFRIELIRIVKKDPDTAYPSIFKSVGTAPKTVKPEVKLKEAEEKDNIEDIEGKEEGLNEEYGVSEDDLDFLEGEEHFE